jgi:hypothetical protein
MILTWGASLSPSILWQTLHWGLPAAMFLEYVSNAQKDKKQGDKSKI